MTRPGLTLAVGEPAINPVPRQMIERHLAQLAAERGYAGGFEVAIGVEGSAELALKTMNPRLGILGGLSILGTSGIVRPFSCSAYIASIHQGIDVARANGVRHIAACTGNASEDAMRRRYGLPEIALIEMGDFAGAVLKHLRKAPVEKLSLCGGFGKISKLAGGHLDLHSRHSSIDLPQLAGWAAALGASAALQDCMRAANTSQQALAQARRRRGPGRCGLRPRPALRPRHRAHRGGAGSLRHRPPGQPGRPGLRGAPMKRLLLLGGIGEALALARRLGPAHLYSLAGLGRCPATWPARSGSAATAAPKGWRRSSTSRASTCWWTPPTPTPHGSAGTPCAPRDWPECPAALRRPGRPGPATTGAR